MSSHIEEKIERLKQFRNAVILAHNYQIPEVQDIADFVGDSLGLSVQAAATQADTIVFCGVLFMAETAAILSPQKNVLLPDLEAGCPMADMITAAQLRELKAKHPGALTVCYVNTPAEVKAECDYCCTSSNAVELVNRLPEDKEIIFVPDKHLGQYVADQTGRDMILWPGYCPTHVRITEDDIRKVKQEHPDALVLAHPECGRAVYDVTDEMLSTGQMIKFAKQSSNSKFIIATELGILHTLKKQNPDKEFFAASEAAVCPNMKKITLEKVAWSLEDNQFQVKVNEEITSRARKALDRMLEVLPAK
ncbi:MAG: quinolinate synthase NadA [Planctomycetes bacterium]|nr:quinolinate synthase NadA [Planctomycetota bacterium]